MEDRIFEILGNYGLPLDEKQEITEKLLNLFSVNTRELEDKGLEYAYELAKETGLNKEDGTLYLDVDSLHRIAKDYVKHIKHFLNVC